MVTLLQKYDQPSDADAVDAAENDRRWQLVLGTSGSESAPFGQGIWVRFRTRAIANDLDQKLRPGPGRGAPAIANLYEVARRRAA